MKIRWTSFIAAACIAFCCDSFAAAGVIIGSGLASGPGLGFASVALVSTPNPNNDNVPAAGVGDNNVVVPLKRFDVTGYIDTPLSVTDTNGTTEYTFTEFVDNNTGTAWSGLRMELGLSGLGGSLAPVLTPDLDFDAPDYDTPPSSTVFSFVATPNPQTLVFTGGLQSAGAQQYTFRVDVPDRVSHGAGFILRETPIPANVPESASIILVAGACGLGGLVRYRSASMRPQ